MKLASALAKLGAFLVASTILTGCATPALWAKKAYRPADHPRLALALGQDGKDVLVCYDERCGKSSEVRRRAYWLFANTAKADKRVKPEFSSPAAYSRLNPIAVLEPAETNAAPAEGYCALADPGSGSFHLWRDSNDVGIFSLPVYDGAPPATLWRVGLTPVAAATDAAIVGLCCMGQAAH